MLPRWIRGPLARRIGRTLLWSQCVTLGAVAFYYCPVIRLGAIADQPQWAPAFAASLALAFIWLLADSLWRALKGIAIYAVLLLIGEGIRYVYVWGHDEPTIFHWGYVLLGGWFIAAVDLMVARLSAKFPRPGIYLITINRVLGWSSFRKTFKRARWPLNAWYMAVALIYVLYQLNEELGKGTNPPSGLHHIANWFNEHIFSFPLFGENFQAKDIIPIEILGYLMYGIAEFLYRWRCPRMLSTGEVADRTPPKVFSRTLRDHGGRIPPRDLALTMDDLVEPYVEDLASPAADRLWRSQEQLRRIAAENGTTPVPAAAAAAADMAWELPDTSAHQLSEIGEELFNMFYPRTRVVIHLLVLASAFFGLVPVIGKTLLVWAPRLARSLSW